MLMSKLNKFLEERIILIEIAEIILRVTLERINY